MLSDRFCKIGHHNGVCERREMSGYDQIYDKVHFFHTVLESPKDQRVKRHQLDAVV